MFQSLIKLLNKVDPAGGKVTPLTDTATRLTQQQQLGGPGTQAASAQDWFGPGQPLNPVAPLATAGRAFDYPVNYNVNTRPRTGEQISFDMLRGIADGYDLLRLVIETRKDQVEAFEWDIVAKEDRTVSQAEIDAVKMFFKSPDKEEMWNTWLRKVLEDLLVIDAVAIYPRLTKGGGLYSLDLLDGGTIKRVLDGGGRTPLPPDPAYQQVLKGLPAVDYTSDDLLYFKRNSRTNRIYGYSPVEQVIMTVNIALRRQISQLQYYTEGNIPEAIAGVPETWSMDTLQQFQLYWDTMLEGNTAQRRHMKFVPLDASKIHFPKSEVMKDQFDEWLARIICFAFSISPTALVKETNRATANSTQAAAQSEGLIPTLNYIKNMLDIIIQRCLKNDSVEFKWLMKTELAPLEQAQVDDIYIKNNVMSIDEVRSNLGLDPQTPEEKARVAALTAPPPAANPALQGEKPTAQRKEAAQ